MNNIFYLYVFHHKISVTVRQRFNIMNVMVNGYGLTMQNLFIARLRFQHFNISELTLPTLIPPSWIVWPAPIFET